MLDHVGFTVSDYARSKAFYAKALAPLGLTLIMEPVAEAAGFGEGGKPFFWIETRGPAAQGIHVAPSRRSARKLAPERAGEATPWPASQPTTVSACALCGRPWWGCHGQRAAWALAPV